MSAKRLFGTDGIRGVANQYPMDPQTLVKIGRALVQLLNEEVKPDRPPKIVIGRDTRVSGPMIEGALAAGICAQGGKVRIAGKIPTPGVAFTTAGMRAVAGIMISASHNPYQDNGIKIFTAEGYKIPDDWETKIENLVEKDQWLVPLSVGNLKRIEDADGRYAEFLKNTFPKQQTLSGLKIVLDCANGAGYKVAPIVFEELDCELIVINCEPNGININANCGAVHPEELQAAVLKHKADVGISLDGDADRFIAVDEKGKVRDGDFIMAICATQLAKENKLVKNTLVATEMSNFGLEKTLTDHNIKLIRTDVGDRFVVQEMKKQGYNFGGEQCGHLVFIQYNTTGDGILSALQLLATMQKTKKSLSVLSSVLKKTPQVLVNVKVKEKKPFKTLVKVAALVKEIEQKLVGQGRVLLRYSGTEKLARVMIEGEDKSQIEVFAQEIAKAIKEELC
jgi:phosphoglucosamine mutase